MSCVLVSLWCVHRFCAKKREKTDKKKKKKNKDGVVDLKVRKNGLILFINILTKYTPHLYLEFLPHIF